MLKPFLEELRKAAGYKQWYVAEVLGITQSEYSRVEKGYRKLQYSMAEKLAVLYDVDVHMLMERFYNEKKQ